MNKKQANEIERNFENKNKDWNKQVILMNNPQKEQYSKIPKNKKEHFFASATLCFFVCINQILENKKNNATYEESSLVTSRLA